MTSEIKVDTISEQTSANGVTIDGLTIKDGNIIGDVALAGTTPTFTIGDAGAEDAALIFDGNAQDFYIALDDSADDLIIGLGAAVGTTPMLSFTEAKAAAFTGAVSMATTLTLTGNADFNGDLDVDGTSNLDVVDIDGAVDMASTLQVDGAITSSAGATITTADNLAQLTLISTDADANPGPFISFYRNSGSAADNDFLGKIVYTFNNDAPEVETALAQYVIARDVSNGSEDIEYKIEMMTAGAVVNRFGLAPTETIFNEDSADVDFRVESNSLSHMLFVDANLDKVAIGHDTPTAMLHVKDNANDAVIKIETTDADASVGPILELYRNSSSPADNDQMASINFVGRNDNSQDVEYAKIRAFATDVSDGSEDVLLAVVAKKDGTDRDYLKIGGSEVVFNEDSQDVDFRVESNNNINMFKVDAGDDRTHHGGSSHNGSTLGVHNFYSGTTADQPGIILSSNASNYGDELITVGCLRSASASYFLYEGRSGNGSDDAFNDIEFKVNGAGSVLCDDTFQNNGADYAEFFETTDGNAIALGTTVVLENNKVRATTNDDATSAIIGIVRPKTEGKASMIIGNSAWNKWEGKYLSDDFGQFIKEEITVTAWKDDAGKDHSYETDRIPDGITAPSDATVITTEKDGVTKLTRNKLNPSFDKSKTYSPRQDRDEWVVIGMLGQIPVLKGQPTGTNWIKMRDISSDVEEWLVR